MLHRVVYGSLERFIGILLEHTSGNLPLWLSPMQIRVLSFTDRNIDACKKVVEKIGNVIPEIRMDADFTSTTVGDKVRTAEMQKVPVMITIGDKEEKSGEVAVRVRGEKCLKNMEVGDLVEELRRKIKNRS